MLARLRLRNFKSFVDTEVRFDSFTLVIGSNGAGKSNLFDALRLLRSVGEGSSFRDAIEGHMAPSSALSMIPGIRGGSRSLTHMASGSPVFHLDLETRSSGRTISYSLSVNAQTFRVVREELSCSWYAGPYVFSTHPEVSPLTQDPDSPAINARFYKKRQGANPRRQFSPHQSILSQFSGRNAESIANEQVADSLRQELIAVRPLELRPEVLRGYSSLGQFELGEHGENFAALVWLLTRRAASRNPNDPNGSELPVSDVVQDARDRLAAIRAWLSELTPHRISDVSTEDAPTGEVVFTVREDPFVEPLTARSLSDGTLRFAALTFAVLGSGDRRTFLIEELENGINPSRQALLVRMLEQATRQGTGAQVIASTHGPGVLDFAQESTVLNTLVMGWDHERASSQVTRLASIRGLAEARSQSRLGDLLTEGWFQFATDV